MTRERRPRRPPARRHADATLESAVVSESRGARLAPIVLAAAAVLAFATSLGAPFFLDDGEAIECNPYITALTPIGRALASPPQSAVSGRPLVSLSLTLNHAAGGLDPFGYHAWNLAVHVACGLLVFGIVRRTLRTPIVAGTFGASADLVAGAVALLWLVHPLHTEIVAYVVTRTETMMALCYLTTLYAAIRGVEGGGARWLALSVAACVAGALTKESIVTAPLMALLYDATFAADSLREAVRRRGGFHAALLASWLVLLALHRDAPRSRSAGFSTGVSSWDYLLTQPPILADYLRQAVWPHPLVADYGVTVPATLAAVWLPGAVVVALLGATLWLWRRTPALAYVATWCFVTLAPASSIVPIATEMGATRRMYLPLIGLVVLAVVGVSRLARRLPERTRPAAAAAAVLVTATAWAATSAVRGLDYRDPVRIWQSVVDVRPHGRAQHNLGIALAAQGRTDEALERYRLAAELLPEARYSLGYLLASRGEDAAAAAQLREFLARKPDDAQAPLAANLLGMVLARQGDRAGAIAAFERTLTMQPRNEDARRGLADALTAQGAEAMAAGRLSEASDAFTRLVAAVPDAPGAYLNLGTSLMQQARDGEAEQAFRRGLAAAPDHPGLRNALAAALATRGALAEAAAEFERVLAADPGNAEARHGLEVLARRRLR